MENNYPLILKFFLIFQIISRKKIKTRAGGSVLLQDLIDQAAEKAFESIKQKQGVETVESDLAYWKDTALKVGVACIVYNDLSQRRHLDYIFSFERMLSDKGNTAVYMLYAYVRIQSIIRKCKEIE